MSKVTAARRLAGVGHITVGRLARFHGESLLIESGEKRRLALRLIHGWGREIVKLLALDIDVRGVPPNIPALLVGNHRSYLDVAVLASVVPSFFLAKKEILHWPLFGRAAKACGMIFVDRASPLSRREAMRDLAARLQDGASVVVFPEGTTTAGPGMAPFRPGTFRMAHANRIPVATFAVEYSNPSLAWVSNDTFIDHFLRTQTGPRHRIRLSFGDCLNSAEDNSPDELRDRAHGAVAQLLGMPHVTA